ncbi:hypothetical protein F5880DRAFT_1619643 [Lentinula raphanica]|nr:hypothetical protein F5880DRAFT_1619643 [Lentinula raphanica]
MLTINAFFSVASAKSPDSKSIVATDACLGLQWFKITPDRLKNMSVTYHPQESSSNIPLPVLFINQGQAAIVGSTKGFAAIFETRRGEKIQALKHGSDRTWITALAYVESASGHCRMIATGDGNRGKQTRIIVWAEDKKGSSFKLPKFWHIMHEVSTLFLTMLRMVFALMGVISALAWLRPSLWTEVIELGSLAKNSSAYISNLDRVASIPSSATTTPTATATATDTDTDTATDTDTVPVPVPVPVPAPAPAPATTTATSHPFKNKAAEILDVFGELLAESQRTAKPDHESRRI